MTTFAGKILSILLFASSAHAAATLQISGPAAAGPGNVYQITLMTGAEGVSFLLFDLVTDTGFNQFGVVYPPTIPMADPTCGAPVTNCDMDGVNPVINPTNPNGLNGFGLFTFNTPPTGPATYTTLAEATFSFPGADQISLDNVSGFDAAGSPLTFSALPVFDIAASTWPYRANFTHHVTSDAADSAIIEDRHVFIFPDANRFITPNHNPGGGPGIATVDSTLIKPISGFWDLIAYGPTNVLLEDAAFNVLVVDSAATIPHTSFSENIYSNYTLIDHIALNGKPNLRLLVQQWDTDGLGLVGGYPSLFYSTSFGKWAIFLQDTSAGMPQYASFDVLILPDDSTSFVHTATAATAATVLDHPQLNGIPDALIQISQLWNPGGVGGIYNNHPVAVAYDDGLERWTIQNEDSASFNIGASFNVFVPPAPSFAWQHVTDQANVFAHTTDTTHPSANGSRTPILLETQNLAPENGGGVGHPEPTGLYYSGFPGWSLFSEDAATAYPVDAASNLYQPPIDFRTYVHVARASTISGNVSRLAHPLTQGDPDAILFATRHWSMDDESAGVYSDHNFGLYYNGTGWAVFNEDSASHDPDIVYNVHVAGPDSGAFTHTASGASISGDRTTIDDVLTNVRPYLGLIVTHNWNPPGTPGTYNDHPIGVDYDSVARRWQIVNLDGAPMPTNASFNILPVLVPEPDVWLMFGAGVALLFALHRSRRAKRHAGGGFGSCGSLRSALGYEPDTKRQSSA